MRQRHLLQVLTEENSRVQRLLLNYLSALLRSLDFTIVYYQMRELELEYIRTNYLLMGNGHFSPGDITR